MALLTNESNNNHTPYEAREVDIITFDLSGGLEQESYGVHDIKNHHKRPRAMACSSTCNSKTPRFKPSPNY